MTTRVLHLALKSYQSEGWLLLHPTGGRGEGGRGKHNHWRTVSSRPAWTKEQGRLKNLKKGNCYFVLVCGGVCCVCCVCVVVCVWFLFETGFHHAAALNSPRSNSQNLELQVGPFSLKLFT